MISSLSPIHFMRVIKYKFWEENEVVIQEILAWLGNLKKWILSVSNSVSQYFPTILSQNLPCFLHLRFKQQAPSEWASDKKKGSMTVSFPKTWKFNHFLCLILSSLRKMSGFWNSFSDPFFHEKRWVGDSLTKLRNLPHENFSLKKEALDPKTPFLEGWALLLWL